MEGVLETGEQSKNSDNLKPWQFRKGQSGNPSGRPKGSKSLKEYAKEMLRDMTDEERQDFLHGLSKETIWKLAEGNPAQDVTSAGEKIEGTVVYLPKNERVETISKTGDSSTQPSV